MTQHRDLEYGDRLPESLLDALGEVLSTYISPNFELTLANATTIQVVAGVDNDQVGVMMNGRWRYNSATANAAMPGSAAGTYDVFVTGSDNSFTGGAPETDNTVYAFGLQIKVQGQTPATALYRKVGTLTFDGSSITGAQLEGPSRLGKVAQTIGNGTLTQIDVLHSLGTRDVLVSVRQAASPYELVFPAVQALDANTVRLFFAVAPASGAYVVTVIG